MIEGLCQAAAQTTCDWAGDFITSISDGGSGERQEKTPKEPKVSTGAMNGPEND
jgi:hypothetical protein